MIKNLFTQHDRILTINGELAWVNVWPFEGLVSHSERPFKRSFRHDDPADALPGAFLEHEGIHPWQRILEEQLQISPSDQTTALYNAIRS